MGKQSDFVLMVKSASVYVESATECRSFEQLAPDMDEEEEEERGAKRNEEEERMDEKDGDEEKEEESPD